MRSKSTAASLLEETIATWGPAMILGVIGMTLVWVYGERGSDEPIPLYIVPATEDDRGVEYRLLDRAGLLQFCREELNQ